MSFLPPNYNPPPKEGGKYFKPQKGDNKVRIVSSSVVGWVGWDKTGEKPTPKRVTMADRAKIAHLNTADDRIAHFWAFAVLDRADNQIKIWEVTQATIQEAIDTLIKDPDWGHPGSYDLSVRRSGDGLETTYTVMPSPKQSNTLTDPQKGELAKLDLEQLFSGGDPFGEPLVDEKDDIPF